MNVIGFTIKKVLGVKNWRGVKDTSNAVIYQTRRGNGSYGTKLGKLYQDCKPYKVPWPNGNPAAVAAGAVLAHAVLNWTTIISAEDKAEYNRRAKIKNIMSGYNLYISEYIKANY
jgi:hypothetical protein